MLDSNEEEKIEAESISDEEALGLGLVKRTKIILPYEEPITIGQEIINIVDPDQTLAPADRDRLLALADRDALEKFCEDNLGDTISLDLQNAQKILGALVTQKFNVPELLMVWRFYSIAGCRRAIEHCDVLMRDEDATMDEQIKAVNIHVEACKSLDRLIANAQKMMDLVAPRDRSKEAVAKRKAKKQGKDSPAQPKRNLPPDLSLPPAAAVQQAATQ